MYLTTDLQFDKYTCTLYDTSGGWAQNGKISLH